MYIHTHTHTHPHTHPHTHTHTPCVSSMLVPSHTSTSAIGRTACDMWGRMKGGRGGGHRRDGWEGGILVEDIGASHREGAAAAATADIYLLLLLLQRPPPPPPPPPPAPARADSETNKTEVYCIIIMISWREMFTASVGPCVAVK